MTAGVHASPTAMVTGPTAGIGRAFAERLARDGHDLVLVARTESRLRDVAADLAARHGVATEVIPADLGDREACHAVEDRLAAEPVDVLVNNAGFSLNRSFVHGDIDAEEHMLDVLVRAVLRLSHAAVGPMVARGRGAILNVASVAAYAPLGTYSAHKAWVTTFSQALATDVRRRGVHVMALCPGFVRTEMHERMGADTSDLPSWVWLDADAVVAQAMTDLARGRDLSIPDVRYKVAAAALRHVPARLAGRIARALR